jgi:hypothetical protein
LYRHVFDWQGLVFVAEGLLEDVECVLDGRPFALGFEGCGGEVFGVFVLGVVALRVFAGEFGEVLGEGLGDSYH